MNYVCKKYPDLIVYHNGDFFKFKNGAFKTTDKGIQKKLEKVADIQNVQPVGGGIEARATLTR